MTKPDKPPLTKAERYVLLEYRLGKERERSTALPKAAYFDPARSALFPAEREARAAERAKRRQ